MTSNSKNNILIQMIQQQKKNIPLNVKLELNDIKRILVNIEINPFSESQCCLWNGNYTENDKTKYINFYLKHRKVALHRLLYINYINNINNTQYLKFSCSNKGLCCNINHIELCITPIKDNNLQCICNPERSLEHIINHKDDNEIKKNNYTSGLQVIKLINNNIENKRKFIIVLSD